jgi:hypothetical protein
MTLIKIIVFVVCLAAAVGVAMYKIRNIRKAEEAKGYVVIPHIDYEKFFHYDFWYCLGILFIGIEFLFSPCFVCFNSIIIPGICFTLARFGKKFDRWQAKEDAEEEKLSNFSNKIKERSKKNASA